MLISQPCLEQRLLDTWKNTAGLHTVSNQMQTVDLAMPLTSYRDDKGTREESVETVRGVFSKITTLLNDEHHYETKI